jgi:hypothetical protein
VKVVVAAGQVEALHVVVALYFWQAPAAHRPLLPQLAAPWSTHRPVGSVAPVATLEQTPIVPGRAQDLHAALQAVAQQTPCAQTLEAHSTFEEQPAPGSFLPHELPLQTFGATQFVDTVQATKHFCPLQANGAQGLEPGATHCPVLLQAEAAVKTLLAHFSPAQTVPGRYLLQPLAPSQRPSVPQDAAP